MNDPRARSGALAAALVLCGLTAAGGQQIVYLSGQTIAPAFEGWEQNPDGSFNLVFGYFNRNLEEHLHVPIGPDNRIEPGGPDQGQPTWFMPRRNRFHFKVRVPADFGDQELVWTLTTQGRTEKAYATLIPEYIIDKQLPMLDVGNFGRDPEGRDMLNEAPTVALEVPAAQRVAVGAPLHLAASAGDDGMPEPKPAPQGRPGSPRSRANALGLRVAWYVYRGDGAHVAFDPPQFKAYPDYRLNSNSPWSPGWETPPLPADLRWPVTATFSQPGEYVVRVLATDGGLTDHRDVAVTVQ